MTTKDVTEKTPLLNDDSCTQKYMGAFLLWFFTDWPWKTTKYINKIPRDENTSERNTESETEPERCDWKICCKICSLILLIILRLSLIGFAIVAQLITCFQRDSPDITAKKLQIHDRQKP